AAARRLRGRTGGRLQRAGVRLGGSGLLDTAPGGETVYPHASRRQPARLCGTLAASGPAPPRIGRGGDDSFALLARADATLLQTAPPAAERARPGCLSLPAAPSPRAAPRLA